MPYHVDLKSISENLTAKVKMNRTYDKAEESKIYICTTTNHNHNKYAIIKNPLKNIQIR